MTSPETSTKSMPGPVTCPVSCKLVCHPETPSPDVNTINVRVENVSNGTLALAYDLQGNIETLCIPPEQNIQRADELWKHTCFEAFLMAGDGPGYREYNVSPSGEWATYSFRDYRQPIDTGDESAPAIRVHRNDQQLTLQVKLPSGLSQPGQTPYPSIRMGLSVVVETVDGDLSYWALQHPPGKPDFHHLDAFALCLAVD